MKHLLADSMELQCFWGSMCQLQIVTYCVFWLLSMDLSLAVYNIRDLIMCMLFESPPQSPKPVISVLVTHKARYLS